MFLVATDLRQNFPATFAFAAFGFADGGARLRCRRNADLRHDADFSQIDIIGFIRGDFSFGFERGTECLVGAQRLDGFQHTGAYILDIIPLGSQRSVFPCSGNGGEGTQVNAVGILQYAFWSVGPSPRRGDVDEYQGQ